MNTIVTSLSPIRFAEDIQVSKLWKMAENLIDFGGKGHTVVALRNNVAYVDINSEIKPSYVSMLISGIKVAAIASLCLSVFGAAILFGILAYNRNQYKWSEESPIKSDLALKDCAEIHVTFSAERKALDTTVDEERIVSSIPETENVEDKVSQLAKIVGVISVKSLSTELSIPQGDQEVFPGKEVISTAILDAVQPIDYKKTKEESIKSDKDVVNTKVISIKTIRDSSSISEIEDCNTGYPILKYADMTSTKVYGNYELLSGDSMNPSFHWTQFSLSSRKFKQDDFKIHISIKRTKKNLEKAFNIIFPILERHQIASFKIAPLEKMDSLGNPLGKEYTIYIQQDEKQLLPKILKEISESLKKNQIEKGSRSQADRILLGSHGFIGVRSTTNIFGTYIEADDLGVAGFTHDEASALSSCDWDNFEIGESNPLNEAQLKSTFSFLVGDHPKLDQRELTKELNNDSKIFYSSFVEDITKYVQYFSNYNLFLSLIIGSGKNQNKYVSVEHFNEIKELLNILFIHKCTDVRLNTHKISNLHQAFIPNEAFFKPYFTQAAALIDQIKKEDNISDKIQIGNILPAIYFHCICPLVQKIKSGNEIISLSKDEENNFINQIVLCALRKRESFPEPVGTF